MNPIKHLSIFGALLGAAISAHASPVLFPNGGFETPGGASWAEVSGGITYSYPLTGGNPDGYGVMDAQNGQWAIWVANENTPITLASLGLTAGSTYTFFQDMKILAGTNIGGVKIESWSDTAIISDSGDIRPTKIGTGSTWERYTFSYTVAPGATGVKIVPLWGVNSSVGYDNLGVDNAPAVTPPPSLTVPNGDFEIAGGASWILFQGGGQGVTYPSTGGNPNGYALINSAGLESYAVLVWNNNATKSLTSLGLTAGKTYTFQQDMKLFSGTNIGGFKLEYNGGSTGDIYPALIGNGSTWETYSFPVTLPANATDIKIVALWGPGSNVGFDNFKIQLPAPPLPAVPGVGIGRAVTWSPTSTTNTYQPQRSTDGTTWTNFGPLSTGTAVNSAFDPTPAPFYRVQESVPSTIEAVLNGSFEDSDPFDATYADLWSAFQSSPPVRVTTMAHTGNASVRIQVGEAQGSEIQQNIATVGGSITPGNTYTFSFWANQISNGPSYVQQFKVSWLTETGAVVGDGGFQVFSGAIGNWEKKMQAGLVAPPNATTALIQILGITGTVTGGFGGSYIDDVSLTTTGVGDNATIISATAMPSAQVKWTSVTGKTYQVQSSLDLSSWSNFGTAVTGDNTVKSVYDAPLVTRKFFRLIEM